MYQIPIFQLWPALARFFAYSNLAGTRATFARQIGQIDTQMLYQFHTFELFTTHNTVVWSWIDFLNKLEVTFLYHDCVTLVSLISVM